MLDIGLEKWLDLGKELRSVQGPDARFEHVYLIDDFTASGTTFVRQVDGTWKGKLTKFNELVRKARVELGDNFPIADGYSLHIHHYVSTDQARRTLEGRVEEARNSLAQRCFGSVAITEGVRLPASLQMLDGTDAPMLGLCDFYYDDELYQRLKKHCDEANQSNMRRGYADCALPLVLEHNTPNNAISLLWAETGGRCGRPMRPLFRRRDRHG
jgi:hypothetical protein